MQCPQCQAVVPDGTAICPRCDAILDTSFLGEEFHAVGGAPAARPAPASAAPPRAAAPPRPTGGRPAVAARPAPAAPPPDAAGALAPYPAPPPVAAAPAAPADEGPDADADPEAEQQRVVGTRIVQLDIERDKGTRIVQMPPALPQELKEKRAAEARAKKRAEIEGEAGGGRFGKLALEESAVSRDFDATLERAKLIFQKLDRIDRPLFYAFTVMVVSCFAPWIVIRGEGMLAAIQDPFGLVATVAALVGLGALAARAWRRLRGGSLVLLELAAALTVAGASIYRFLTLSTIDGRAHVGLPLSVLAAAVAFLFGLVRLVK